MAAGRSPHGAARGPSRFVRFVTQPTHGPVEPALARTRLYVRTRSVSFAESLDKVAARRETATPARSLATSLHTPPPATRSGLRTTDPNGPARSARQSHASSGWVRVTRAPLGSLAVRRIGWVGSSLTSRSAASRRPASGDPTTGLGAEG